MTTIDDDTAGIKVSPDSVTFDESGSDTFTVELTSEPTADVTVFSVVDGGTGVDASGSLVFTATNWNALWRSSPNCSASTIAISGVSSRTSAPRENCCH